MPNGIVALLDAARQRGDIDEPLDAEKLAQLVEDTWADALHTLVEEEHLHLADIPDFLEQAGYPRGALATQCRFCLARVVATAPGLRWAFSALSYVAEGAWGAVGHAARARADFWRELGLYDTLLEFDESGWNLTPLLKLTWLVCRRELWESVEEVIPND